MIKSGKSTVASFNLQYLKEGTGSYNVTVTWPSEGGWFSAVVLDLGSAGKVSVTPSKEDVQAVFSKTDVAVGSYDVGLTFTNGSGTTVDLPMMDTAKIYNALASSGTIELTEDDLVPVSDPAISIAGQKTVTLSCGTEGAAVYYTIDGTDPASSATKRLYSSPFDVSDASATVRAVGSRAGYRDSDAAGKKMDGSDPDGESSSRFPERSTIWRSRKDRDTPLRQPTRKMATVQRPFVGTWTANCRMIPTMMTTSPMAGLFRKDGTR